MRGRLLVWWFAIGVAAGACHSNDAVLDQRLDAALAPLIARVPGAVVLVERNGTVVFRKAYGLADIENHAAMTPDAVFAIGSVSKQFGAAAVMQLVEKGKLELSDKLSRFYPDFPRADRITIHDLLAQQTGIVDFEYNGTWPQTMAVEHSQDEVIATFRDLPPLFEPTTSWAYSSSNYVLLGRIVEKVSGEPLAQYLDAHVLKPAGLQHTRFCDAHALIPNRALGYDVTPAGFVPAKFSLLTQFSLAGGLCSTADDLLAWQHALESGRVVSDASYRAMSTAQPLGDGSPTGYGYGLFPSLRAGHRMIGHSGGVSGYGALLEHLLDDDIRVVVLVNTEEGPLYGFERALTAELAPLPPLIAKPIDAATLARFAGKVPFLGETLTLTVERDHLAVQLGSEPTVLVYVGTNTFEDASRRFQIHFDMTNSRISMVMISFGGMTSYSRL